MLDRKKTQNKMMRLLNNLAEEVRASKEIERRVLEQISYLPKKLKITPVKVVSVVPLLDEEIDELENILNLKLSGQVIVKNVVDKNILGGLKIIIDSKVIDSSLAGQLGRLESRFKKMTSG